MSKENIIRAWKDPEYRSSLSAHQHALLPPSPAGMIDDGKLAEVAGGASPVPNSFCKGCLTVLWSFLICCW
jgi:mersacidin/lichenicidin family type 2 lantibiotic